MGRTPPLKPRSSVTTVTFPKVGPASVSSVDLTREKLGREQHQVDCFVRAIAQRGVVLAPALRPVVDGGRDYPDFVTRESDASLALEITEVQHERHARYWTLRDNYADAVTEALLPEERSQLSGCAVQLEDNYQAVEWPPSRSPEGRAIVEIIAAAIRGFLGHDDMHVGARLEAKLQDDPARPYVRVSVLRVSPPEHQVPMMVFYGAGFPIALTERVGLLARTVRKKLDADYPDVGRAWLVAVTSRTSALFDSVATDLARQEIERGPNPFEQVWWLHLGDVPRVGQVWPKDPDELPAEPPKPQDMVFELNLGPWSVLHEPDGPPSVSGSVLIPPE